MGKTQENTSFGEHTGKELEVTRIRINKRNGLPTEVECFKGSKRLSTSTLGYDMTA